MKSVFQVYLGDEPAVAAVGGGSTVGSTKSGTDDAAKPVEEDAHDDDEADLRKYEMEDERAEGTSRSDCKQKLTSSSSPLPPPPPPPPRPDRVFHVQRKHLLRLKERSAKQSNLAVLQSSCADLHQRTATLTERISELHDLLPPVSRLAASSSSSAPTASTTAMETATLEAIASMDTIRLRQFLRDAAEEAKAVHAEAAVSSKELTFAQNKYAQLKDTLTKLRNERAAQQAMNVEQQEVHHHHPPHHQPPQLDQSLRRPCDGNGNTVDVAVAVAGNPEENGHTVVERIERKRPRADEITGMETTAPVGRGETPPPPPTVSLSSASRVVREVIDVDETDDDDNDDLRSDGQDSDIVIVEPPPTSPPPPPQTSSPPPPVVQVISVSHVHHNEPQPQLRPIVTEEEETTNTRMLPPPPQESRLVPAAVPSLPPMGRSVGRSLMDIPKGIATHVQSTMHRYFGAGSNTSSHRGGGGGGQDGGPAPFVM